MSGKLKEKLMTMMRKKVHHALLLIVSIINLMSRITRYMYIVSEEEEK
jgi:hypothetical protein